MGLFKREKKYIVYGTKKKYTEKQIMEKEKAEFIARVSKNREHNELCKKYEIQLIKKAESCITGISIHKVVNEIYETQLTEKEKEIVKNYYYTCEESYNYLKYVPFFLDSADSIVGYLDGVWWPLIEYDYHRAEQIAYYIIENYILKNTYVIKEGKASMFYENPKDIDMDKVKKSDLNNLHYKLAYRTYKKCENTPEVLEFVAKHGLESYKLKDVYFKIDPAIKTDHSSSWKTLCKVLKLLGRYDEAIEIATFAFENDAYDKTKGGWEARLEKLIKAKQKATTNK